MRRCFPHAGPTLRSFGRRLSTAALPANRWHVAIVGSGPSGYYTADHLLKNNPDVCVDLYERLPVPFGLVRYGVAPDHQSVKNVTERFGQISADPRCSLLANVQVGAPASRSTSSHVTLETLREQYHAVVLAYGADTDRRLGIPGEELKGVHAARDFVEWYNGHPFAAGADFNLSQCETAVLIGNGVTRPHACTRVCTFIYMCVCMHVRAHVAFLPSDLLSLASFPPPWCRYAATVAC